MDIEVVIASAAKQSMLLTRLDCFVASLLAMTRYRGGSRTLLLDLVVNLPETHGAFGGFCGQPAVILAGELQRLFGDRLLERPLAEDGLDRRPLQPG
jgi:hypothetical protein